MEAWPEGMVDRVVGRLMICSTYASYERVAESLREETTDLFNDQTTSELLALAERLWDESVEPADGVRTPEEFGLTLVLLHLAARVGSAEVRPGTVLGNQLYLLLLNIELYGRGNLMALAEALLLLKAWGTEDA